MAGPNDFLLIQNVSVDKGMNHHKLGIKKKQKLSRKGRISLDFIVFHPLEKQQVLSGITGYMADTRSKGTFKLFI